MPFFIDPDRRRVVVRPDSFPQDREFMVEDQVAAEWGLSNGSVISMDAVERLQELSVGPALTDGLLSTDGTFFTITTAAGRKHFVIATDDLPNLNSPVVMRPDGSVRFDLNVPGDGRTLLLVPAESAIEAEKAVALMLSIERTRKIAPSPPQPVSPVGLQGATNQQQYMEYQMNGWSNRDLSRLCTSLSQSQVSVDVDGITLTVLVIDQAAVDSLIDSADLMNSPYATRKPTKFIVSATPPSPVAAQRPPQVRSASPSIPAARWTPSAAEVVQSSSAGSRRTKWLVVGVAAVVLLVVVLNAQGGNDDSPSSRGTPAATTPCTELSQIVSDLRSGTLTPLQVRDEVYTAADVLDSVRWGIVAGSIRGLADSGLASQSIVSIQGYLDQKC